MAKTPQRDHFWAKLSRDENGDIIDWHSLLAHSADVAACTEALLDKTILSERMARLAKWEELTEVHVARLSVLAAIHDAGKVNRGFQNRAWDGREPTAGHVRPMVEVLNADNPAEWLMPLGINEMMEWFSSQLQLQYYLLATWGHHGKPTIPDYNFRRDIWTKKGEQNPTEGLEKLFEAVQNWYPEAFNEVDSPLPESPAFQHAFNGLLTLADWLGSDTRFFEFRHDEDNLIEASREVAEDVCETLFLDPTEARDALGSQPIRFDAISEFEPYDIQQTCLELPLNQNGSLTILESDTGSGKTEAALARFARLYQAGLVDGMYFAVPTRSAATQLYERVDKAARRAFPDQDNRPPVVQAVPGYLKVDAIEGVPLPDFDVKWDDDSNRFDYRGWAAEQPKRYLAGSIVVGTVDQILLSTLQVSHAHMRATSLLRHFLVVDEVHASSVYMTELMDRALDQHLEAGGHALLMSATLGTASRVRLTTGGRQTPPEPQEATEVDYPLVTHVDGCREDPEKIPATGSGRTKDVDVETRSIADSPESIAELAFNKASEGARVLVIRNLVDDCIETQRQLESIADQDDGVEFFGVGGQPVPHHSRYAPDDRKRMDEAIEDVFGKETDADSVVAVATQTVEQSLDIDADLMITDLSPIDVLLQRIGRLQRHKRRRPAGFETARCIVTVPEERDMTPFMFDDGSGFDGPHGLGTVYGDLRILEATWRLLEDSTDSTWHIPEDNRYLVEKGTHPQRLKNIVDELGDRWEAHQKYLYGEQLADRQLPDLVGIDRSEPFGKDGFSQDLEAVKTRLGTDNYTVELPESVEGPLGNRIDEVSISETRFDEKPEDIAATDVRVFDGGFSFEVGSARFRYDRFGLSKID